MKKAFCMTVILLIGGTLKSMEKSESLDGVILPHYSQELTPEIINELYKSEIFFQEKVLYFLKKTSEVYLKTFPQYEKWESIDEIMTHAKENYEQIFKSNSFEELKEKAIFYKNNIKEEDYKIFDTLVKKPKNETLNMMKKILTTAISDVLGEVRLGLKNQRRKTFFDDVLFDTSLNIATLKSFDNKEIFQSMSLVRYGCGHTVTEISSLSCILTQFHNPFLCINNKSNYSLLDSIRKNNEKEYYANIRLFKACLFSSYELVGSLLEKRGCDINFIKRELADFPSIQKKFIETVDEITKDFDSDENSQEK